ncbi:AfsR/SARP family transcriptional regulator [Micromonospora sonneratiae]|uniref:BTAD domain-containing putative transcriptional regulator n=1 Tax=Micromonospora sonneratiae TaxID=1184706 RepID=A0ABW3YIE8_9ACTN
MRWRLLGPIEVTAGGRVLGIRRPQQRAVLALLLLNANRLVPAQQLVDALWADEPPASARTQVQVCVSQIRAALRGTELADALVSHAGGYRLAVGDGDLDLAEFTRAVGQARVASDAGQLSTAADLLRAGLALWRGPALAGAAAAFVEAAAAGLAEQHLAAHQQLAAVELALGHSDVVIRTLEPLVAEHPLREQLVAQYMLALAGVGQQARALRLYTETRGRLIEELGVEPGAELAGAHLKVLRNELIEAPAAETVSDAAPAPAAVPAQLPTNVAGFTGREATLRELDLLVPADGHDGQHGTAVVISAIGGTAGVGKTALAVHWAHRVAHRFPDGQLYVNLRGFDIDDRLVTPGEALRGFLEALHVPAQRIPADVSGQAALYRTLLAGRRMLVLLDNAHDPEQVRPLLPGASGCLVVVTSRNRLTGLVAAEGARPLTLDLLSTTESRELLARRLGRGRVAAQRPAVDEIVERCARLPLALAVVAARAATQPDFPLATLAAELADAQGGRLAALDAGDPATDVRAVFSWSYRALDDAAARLFRLLGLHPGPDLAVAAAASLAGVPPSRVRPLLAALTRAHLLTEHLPGRYNQHDLLRSYAAELCEEVDDEPERQAARHRLLDHYLHVSQAADQLLDPYRLAHPITVSEAQPGAATDGPTGYSRALDWFAVEQDVLLAAVEQAARSGFDGHAWQLAAALVTYLDRRGHWHDLAAVQRTALDAAQRRADPLGQAQAHRGIAIACTWLGRLQDAYRHYQRDLDLYRESGDRLGEAHTHIGLSWVLSRQGQPQEAIDQTRQALDLYRAIDYQVGQAKALNNLGWFLARVGEHQSALDSCQQALMLHGETGDRHGAALTWDSLGYVHHELGQHEQATHCYLKALDLHRSLGDRYSEAEVLANLGDTQWAADDVDAAQLTWHEALAIFDELGHPDAAQLRLKVAERLQPVSVSRLASADAVDTLAHAVGPDS